MSRSIKVIICLALLIPFFEAYAASSGGLGGGGVTAVGGGPDNDGKILIPLEVWNSMNNTKEFELVARTVLADCPTTNNPAGDVACIDRSLKRFYTPPKTSTIVIPKGTKGFHGTEFKEDTNVTVVDPNEPITEPEIKVSSSVLSFYMHESLSCFHQSTADNQAGCFRRLFDSQIKN